MRPGLSKSGRYPRNRHPEYDRLDHTQWGVNNGRTFLGKSGCTPRRLLRYSTSDIMVDVSGCVASGKKSPHRSDIASANWILKWDPRSVGSVAPAGPIHPIPVFTGIVSHMRQIRARHTMYRCRIDGGNEVMQIQRQQVIRRAGITPIQGPPAP